MKSLISISNQDTQTLYWVTRLSLLVSVVLLLGNMVSISFICVLLPLKEVRPYLVSTYSKSEQVVKIEALEKNQAGFHVLMEQLACQYVLLRETIDGQTDEARFKKIFWFSEASLHDAFSRHMNKENKDSPLRSFNEKGVSRSIVILSSQYLGPSAPNVWQVEYQAIDRNRLTGEVLQSKLFVSTITAETQSKKVNDEDRLINPIGFTVTAYQSFPKTRSAT